MNYGTIQYDDQTLSLTIAPYIDGRDAHGLAYFTARATDDAGNQYKIRWELLTNWDGDQDDEACDWDDFTVTQY